MFSFLLSIVIVSSKLVSGYLVVLSTDGDVIQGETVRFKGEVFDENGALSPSEYIFIWSDSAVPPHADTFTSKSPAYWNVTYDQTYPPGVYNVTLKVKHSMFLLKTTVGSTMASFNLTEFLKGDIKLSQGKVQRKKYVSNEMPVNHTIVLKDSYLQFLNKTKYLMRMYWFVDCIYYGPQNGFNFVFNYSKVDTIHYVEALLLASDIPNLPKGYDTFSLNKNLVLPNANELLNVTGPLFKGNETRNNEDDDQELKEWLINFNASQRTNSTKFDGDYCLNSSVVPINPKYTYGFFKTNFVVKAPVKISPINGTNWLMDGEVLNINVSCNGSSPYSFCIILKSGLYNITGNETCSEETVIRNCSFGIQHLFKRPFEYTLVVIISNAVSRVVKPIAVNIYKVKKHAQLSVIIVPVSFSLIATILIIFGVAYYVQSKHKYTIEVADFDFGNQTSNMEYKTFRERLRESISNSFLKSNNYENDDSSWSESVPTNRKYGSMQ